MVQSVIKNWYTCYYNTAQFRQVEHYLFVYFIYLFIYLFTYKFAYFSLFKVGLRVVKNCLTNKYQRNKRYIYTYIYI